MSRFTIIFLLLNLYTPTFSSMTDKIISQMQNSNNLSFNFTQLIDEKKESGSCIIKYPKNQIELLIRMICFYAILVDNIVLEQQM